MFQQAYKNGIIQKNPVKRATLPKLHEESDRRVMTREEQAVFMQFTKKLDYGDIFELALSTGLRNGEIRGLEWSDIDFDKKVIHVTGTMVYSKETGYSKGTPKSRTSKRDIPMLDNIYRILKERRKKQLELKMALGPKWCPAADHENLVITNEFGGMIKDTTMQYYMKHNQQLISKDGINFEPIHVRHTFATRCIENGMQPQVLKTILGHSTLAMTMDLYSHVLPDTKADEIQKIANLF